MRILYKYDKNYFEKKVRQTGFIRDNLEKVYRLVDTLEYLNTNPLHKKSLALKGGTAINLTVFNMPRLSVDIDLDFCIRTTKEEMLAYRDLINDDLIKYMNTQGYSLDIRKGKNPHSLDSLVFWYINSVGNRDNIKVEINYSLRSHILPIIDIEIDIDLIDRKFPIKVLSPLELFGTKLNALVNRVAARDLYDIYNMIYYGIFDESQLSMLKKCFLFYYVVGSGKDFNPNIDISKIEDLDRKEIKQSLLPMLRRSDLFELELSKKCVMSFISDLLVLEEDEIEFLNKFYLKEYLPELLFKDFEIISGIKDHPMALWKIRDKSI